MKEKGAKIQRGWQPRTPRIEGRTQEKREGRSKGPALLILGGAPPEVEVPKKKGGMPKGKKEVLGEGKADKKVPSYKGTDTPEKKRKIS